MEKKEKLSARQFQILRLIDDSTKGVSKEDLATKIGCTYRSITTNITALVKKGLIEFEGEKNRKVPGRRKNLYSLK